MSAALLLLLAAADPHAGHDMSAMAAPPAAAAPATPHAGHDMSTMAPPPTAAPIPDPHAGHDMSAMASPPVDAAAPPPPSNHAADRSFDPVAMERAREILRAEHGGARVSMLMANILEDDAGKGRDGYRWDGEGWYGGDLNRAVVKTEGEGAWRGGLEAGEVQALYSRAVGRYTDLQAGVRQDFGAGPSRTYATVGFETLLPYWFQAEGALFVSDKGDVLARFEGTYDLRLTQRVVLQPRAELDFAAQDIAETGTGSGVSRGEFGLRLRYEIRREFAPYIGVSHDRAFGRTADFARSRGEARRATRFVVGLRAWF
jgi:copper resistance protein B